MKNLDELIEEITKMYKIMLKLCLKLSAEPDMVQNLKY